MWQKSVDFFFIVGSFYQRELLNIFCSSHVNFDLLVLNATSSGTSNTSQEFCVRNYSSFIVTKQNSCFCSLFWGWLTDRSGRKIVLLITIAFNGIFAFLFGFSKNLVMAIIFRFLCGASNGMFTTYFFFTNFFLNFPLLLLLLFLFFLLPLDLLLVLVLVLLLLTLFLFLLLLHILFIFLLLLILLALLLFLPSSISCPYCASLYFFQTFL